MNRYEFPDVLVLSYSRVQRKQRAGIYHIASTNFNICYRPWQIPNEPSYILIKNNEVKRYIGKRWLSHAWIMTGIQYNQFLIRRRNDRDKCGDNGIKSPVNFWVVLGGTWCYLVRHQQAMHHRRYLPLHELLLGWYGFVSHGCHGLRVTQKIFHRIYTVNKKIISEIQGKSITTKRFFEKIPSAILIT